MLRLFLILALSLASCSSAVSPNEQPSVEPSPSPRASPDYSWKSILFAHINERVARAQIANLERVKLSAEDVEVRVWRGFDLTLLEGFVLKRIAGKWSAVHLTGVFNGRSGTGAKILGQPKSGWDSCWTSLKNAGLLTLPDATELGKEPIDPDVSSYVVELNVGGSYRSYHYTYPEANDHREAKQMIKIGAIITDEFGLPQFKTTSLPGRN